MEWSISLVYACIAAFMYIKIKNTSSKIVKFIIIVFRIIYLLSFFTDDPMRQLIILFQFENEAKIILSKIICIHIIAV